MAYSNLNNTYFSINAFEPSNTDPKGSPRFLLKQKHTESKSLTMRAAGTLLCTTALNNRAPSMCSLILCFLAIIPT